MTARLPRRRDRPARIAAPKVLKIVGPSGAGKTTLAERLIHDWTKSGLRVGYLKHAAHGFDLDRPGKDSQRATTAGANGVALVGPGTVAFLETGSEARPEDLVARFFAGYDLVLIEGFSMSEAPSLVFPDDEPARGRKKAATGEVIAWVVSASTDGSRPNRPAQRVGRDDIALLRRLVEDRLGF